MKKTLVILIAVPAGLAAVFTAVALLADPRHQGCVTEVFPVPPGRIWGMLTDTERHSLRRHEVKAVEVLAPNTSGLPTWREETGLAGSILLQVTRRVPEKMLVVEMTESGFGMTGTWTFLLEGEAGGTRVTILENSLTEGLVMRGILSIVGRDGNLGLQLKALRKGLAEEHRS